MIAEIVSVGTELLLGEVLNTNAQYLSQRLAELGIDHYFQVTVGDNPDRLRATFRQAVGRADVVIASGGLGPTPDDLTRDIAAEVAGRALQLDEQVLVEISGWFGRTGRHMTDNNRQQALVPAGATVLKNPIGTAPGLAFATPAGQHFILLPGPPHEMRQMFEAEAVPVLTALMGDRQLQLVTRTLRFAGIGESAMAERVHDLFSAYPDITIAPYAKPAECQLRLATKATDRTEGLARLAPVEAEIRRRLEPYIYAIDETPLEAALGELLLAKGWTLATAESCTGGLVSQRITDVPGSSQWFLAGFVTYANAAKTAMLGVPAATLAAQGAVSEETVRAMATGALARSGATVAVATSGIAGPGGGTEDRPVGTVWYAVAGPHGVLARRAMLRGDRTRIRTWATQTALTLLWQYVRWEKFL